FTMANSIAGYWNMNYMKVANDSRSQMNKEELINNTADFVKQTLKNAEGGHDWWHIFRVWNNAKLIAAGESADLFIVELAALLHDIADSKFHHGDEELGPKVAIAFLEAQSVP